jgi:hypothetical protein
MCSKTRPIADGTAVSSPFFTNFMIFPANWANQNSLTLTRTAPVLHVIRSTGIGRTTLEFRWLKLDALARRANPMLAYIPSIAMNIFSIDNIAIQKMYVDE